MCFLIKVAPSFFTAADNLRQTRVCASVRLLSRLLAFHIIVVYQLPTRPGCNGFIFSKLERPQP